MVASTRSRLSAVFGATSPRKTGAHVARIIREFNGGEFKTSSAFSSNLVQYTCVVNKSEGPDSHGERKTRRRPGKENPIFKPCRRYAPLPGDEATSIVASSNEPDNVQLLEPQNIRRGCGQQAISKPSASLSTNPSCESISTSPSTLKFGMYAGRVKANPLKYLATVLRSKLQPHDESCNLLEVATEIHHEAKNKHNTTLRRIYDVVNVLEAAGLLERSNGYAAKRSSRTRTTNEYVNTSNTTTGSPSAAECSKSGLEVGAVFMKCHDEKIEIYSTNQTIFKPGRPDALEKKAMRGSRIRWLGSEAEHNKRYHRQALSQLAEYKNAAAQRISKKQLELEYLQEELRLTTELIDHNKSGTYQSDSFDSTNMSPCTPPPEDLSLSYLNLDDCSPTSAETERSAESFEPEAVIAGARHDQSKMCGQSPFSMSRDVDPGLNNPEMITEDDLNFWYNPSASAVEMNILEAVEQYQSNGLPPAILGTGKKGLHVPFVLLQTNNATNVDIELDGNVTSEVYFVLDNEYKLFDYRELLSSMFPAHDRDGSEFHYIGGR